MLTGYKNLKIGALGGGTLLKLKERIHGMLADYEYVSTYAECGEELCVILSDPSFDGFEIEGDFCKAVIPYLDRITPLAEKIGGVNVILRIEKELVGYNTDAEAFSFLLKRNSISVSGKKALIIGEGATASAIGVSLSEAGAAETVILSLSEAKDKETIKFHDDAQLIVNTTNAGMFPSVDEKPAELINFPALEDALELICFPSRTELMLEAENSGVRTLGGIDMLAHKIKSACKLFTGKWIGDALACRAAASVETEMKNIVLVGMPGCGKSTVAKEFSRFSGRQVIDTDRAVESMVGLSIPEIFELYGEEHFRACESQIIKSAALGTGSVIATGAGAILRSENIRELRRNSVVVFLLREETEIDTANEAKKLSRERMKLYLAASDVIVKIMDTPRETMRAVMKAVCKK